MLCFVYNLFFVYTSKLLLEISISISNLYFRMLCARNLSTSNIYNTYLLDYVSVCGDVTASPLRHHGNNGIAMFWFRPDLQKLLKICKINSCEEVVQVSCIVRLL